MCILTVMRLALSIQRCHHQWMVAQKLLGVSCQFFSSECWGGIAATAASFISELEFITTWFIVFIRSFLLFDGVLILSDSSFSVLNFFKNTRNCVCNLCDGHRFFCMWLFVRCTTDVSIGLLFSCSKASDSRTDISDISVLLRDGFLVFFNFFDWISIVLDFSDDLSCWNTLL